MAACSLGIDPDDVVEDGYGEIQDKLEEYLEKQLFPHYTYCGRTHVAIQFTYKQLEIDLLLSPYWETKAEYYQAMRVIPDPDDRFCW